MMKNNENSENNAQNQIKQKGKKLSIVLIIILILLALTIGIGGGYLLSQNNKTQSNDTNNTNNDKQNENKVVSVVSVEDNNEMVKRQMTIEGRDKDNNTVWSYTTPKENIPVEIVNRGLKLIETKKGKVYLCDWGKLYILDEQTGKVLAKNTEHNMGAAAVYIFDENDNLYTTSYLSAVDKFDTNAKLLKTTESKIWDEGFYWPKKMTLNGDNLTIDYGDEGIVTINKNTLEIVDTKNNNPLNSNNSNTDAKTESSYAKEYIKIINELESEYSSDDLKCDLIYFNNDNVPDLVIGITGYWVSVYMYENGTVYNPIDAWSYGAMGNVGYNYQEKKATILNYNSDFAGAIGSETIAILNSKHEFDTLTYTAKEEGIINENEIPEDELKEIEKAIESYGGYYYNDQKISEEEYNNKINALSININDNNSKELCGTKSIEEVKKQLQ